VPWRQSHLQFSGNLPNLTPVAYQLELGTGSSARRPGLLAANRELARFTPGFKGTLYLPLHHSDDRYSDDRFCIVYVKN
jgi:hypothetical protein